MYSMKIVKTFARISRNSQLTAHAYHTIQRPRLWSQSLSHFSAPTSPTKNPNTNELQGLPQNIQNVVDKDKTKDQQAATRTPTASPASTRQKAKTSSVDPNSSLSTERQEQIEKAFDYCVDLVKTDEPQIYHCLKHIKCTDSERLGIMVLRALHLELSRVRSDANTADAAKIRLQWWLSAIKDIIDDKHLKSKFNSNKKAKQVLGKIDPEVANQDATSYNPNFDATKNPKLAIFKDSVSLATQTPVLLALSIVRRRYNLNPSWLKRFVESREHFLASNTFTSLLELEEYSENTHGLLFVLCTEVLGTAYTSSSNLNQKVSNHIGAFLTIVSVLRSMPFAARNGFIALPDDIVSDYRLWDVENKILQGEHTQSLGKAVTFLCERAYAHLLEARDVGDKLTRPVKSLFLVALPGERFLQQLEKCNFNVFDPKLLKRDDGIGFNTSLIWRAAQNTF